MIGLEVEEIYGLFGQGEIILQPWIAVSHFVDRGRKTIPLGNLLI